MIKDAPMQNGHERYNSLTSLKAAHTTLLKTYKDAAGEEAQLDEIDHFVRTAANTGALLDSDSDRFAVQSLIDYWVTVLYRGKRNPPDATLIEFDPSLLPQLDDSLCPYRGLNAFQESDQDIFFGRQRLLEVLLKKVKTTPILFVVGPSGSGKSSLVLAGLIPALKRSAIPGSETWNYLPAFVPGSDPLRGLCWALGKAFKQSKEWVSKQVEQMKRDPNHLANVVASFSDQPAVVVIDQFEEVFTLCLVDPLRDAFIDNILSLTREPSTRHQVILTVRTDYETYLAHNSGLMSLFEDGQVRVMPLTASELRSAIEEPAKRINLRFEEGVVDSLVKDILGEPEGLPLLQFTLLRLWNTRANKRNRIALQDYRKLGGARRALALTADEFYQSLSEAKKTTLERIMLRLALPSGNAEVLRNKVKREELYFEDPDRVNDVLDRLTKAGLIRVTPGDERKNDKIEITHEALVRHWPTLVGWIDKERVTMRQRLRLRSAAQQWLEHGKDEGGLLGGSLLEEALTYKALNELETEFVAASQAAVKRAERQKEAEQRQKAFRLRLFASVVTVLLVVSLAAAAFGFWQATQASKNADFAYQQKALAETNYAKAVTQTEIADEQRKEAQRQEQIAKDRTEDMKTALAQAQNAEALARRESDRAKAETKRAITASNQAKYYSNLYQNLFRENQKLLHEKENQLQEELELRKQRDEATAKIKRERAEEAIVIYRALLERFVKANDLKGQYETLSQISFAYESIAERAERRRDKTMAQENHAKAVTEYQAALKIVDEESKKAINAAGNDAEKVVSILWEKAQFLRDHKKNSEAEAVYLQILTMQEQVLKSADFYKEQTYDDIVADLTKLYRPQSASKLETLYQRVLRTKRNLHPQESEELYLILTEVATFYRDQRRLNEAASLYREALGILQAVVKKNSIENDPAALDYLVETMRALAETYADNGDEEQAEKYYREALAKQEQKVALINKESNVLADLKVKLAGMLKAQNKYAEAGTLYGEALKLAYAEKNLNATDLVIRLEAIADLLKKQEQPEGIELWYRDAISAFSENTSIKTPIAVSLTSQAKNQYEVAAQQKPAQALRYFKVAEGLLKLAYSTANPQDLSSDAFDSALKKFVENETDDFVETENLFKQLLDMKEESINISNFRLGRSAEQIISALERLYRNRDELKLVALYQRALSMRTKINNGTVNQAVYNSHNDLGRLFLRLERYDEAKTNYKAALGIVERFFGANSAGLVIDSLLNLAAVHVEEEEYAEAEPLYVRARTNLTNNKKENTLKMAEVLEAYASLLRKRGRAQEATTLSQNAQQIRSRLTSSAKP